jgi:diguanylate cyclase (GGDEF)-like protein
LVTIVGLGLLAAIVTVVAPPAGPSLYIAAIATLVVALLYARRNRGLPSRFLLAALWVAALYALGGALRAFGNSSWQISLADATELLGSVALAICVLQLIGGRREMDAGIVGDATIIGLGTWLVSWVVMIEPLIRESDSGLPSSALSGLYLPAACVMAFLVAVVLFRRTKRPPSLLLVCAAIICSLTADVLSGLEVAGHVDERGLDVANGLWVFAYALAAAAFFHPSSRVLIESRHAAGTGRLRGRLLTTALALVTPIVLLAVVAPRSTADTWVRAVSAVVLAAAVTTRVVMSVQHNSRIQEVLRHSAQTDPLTGLPNRLFISEHVDECLRNAWRTQASPNVYFIDLDRFKNINDSLGHAAGDEVLMIVAGRLRTAVEGRAVVGRLSGDEFVVVDVTGPGPGQGEAAMTVAEELRLLFREPLSLTVGDVFVSASIGVSTSNPTDTTSGEDMLRYADTAMYRAKDAGRNCVAVFDPSMHARVAQRLTIETALYRALERRELRLYHQPILDLDSGEVIGFEALMRWMRSDGVVVSPAEFIPIAEDTGTIVPIGAWAALEALTQLQAWIREGVCSSGASMSVNVSPRQLADPNFPGVVQEALSRSGVSAHQLWLEVTEGTMISEPEIALATLRKLRSLGVRIALDDFGTGYSSLSLIQRFPLQRLKIDRAFVQGVADNANDRSLVRTIVAMGRSLGLDLVAEGVESIHQLQVLHELGCTKAQGFLISHPVPAEAMRSTVAALERIGTFPGLRSSTQPTLP